MGDIGRVPADQAGRASHGAASCTASPPSGDHPSREGLCERCNRQYRVWSAASPIWNATVRGGEIGGNEEFSFLCADCFMSMAEDRGVATLFRVTAERTSPLCLRTGDGRIWSDELFLWINPPNTKRQEDADALLPYFSGTFEPLRNIAARLNERKSASQLASRARDLEARGLVESKWIGHYSMKLWRAIATEARSAETVQHGSGHESAGPQDIAQTPSGEQTNDTGR